MLSLAAVLRALPTLLTVLVCAGILTAGVFASVEPGDDRPRDHDGAAGPLALMRSGATEAAPELEEFEPPVPAATAPGQVQPPGRVPPLEPVPELPPAADARSTSESVGRPWKGRLVGGVQFPEAGEAFFTFDSARRTSPSDWWRRWATRRTVGRTLAVLREFHAANPGAPRLGVGDLSLPRGGHFGREYGGLGHKSHQNGQDVDVYFPRRDRREQPPSKPSQVDRALSQDLVDRFVAAGAEMVFVGPSLNLKGPKGVVIELVHHDDHAHVRWPK